MEDNRLDDIPGKVTGACICFIPFLLFLLLTSIFTETNFSQYQNSDPLVRIFGDPLATIVTIVFGSIVSFAWIKYHPVNRLILKQSILWAVAGSLFAGLALLSIYLINGPQIPSFILPEESSESGLVLGLTDLPALSFWSWRICKPLTEGG